MQLSIIENDFDVTYYELVIEESNFLKDRLVNEKMLEDFELLPRSDLERREKLLEDINSYLTRFFGDVEEFFQIESINDNEGAQKAYSYLIFAIGVYESELEKTKKNFKILSFKNED